MDRPDGDALLARLRRIETRAAAAAAAFADATALLPADAAGTDPTGAVTAHLGSDGLPTDLRVAPDWARRLPPEEFGQAVASACRAAADQRAAAWSRELERTAWRARAEDGVARPGPSRSRPHPADPGAGRSVDELGRAARAALRDALRPSPAAEPEAGRATRDVLTLTLTAAGAVECAADPRRVSGQTAATLTDALGAALAEALSRHARAVTDPGPLDGLLAEVLTVLAASPRPIP